MNYALASRKGAKPTKILFSCKDRVRPRMGMRGPSGIACGVFSEGTAGEASDAEAQHKS